MNSCIIRRESAASVPQLAVQRSLPQPIKLGVAIGLTRFGPAVPTYAVFGPQRQLVCTSTMVGCGDEPCDATT